MPESQALRRQLGFFSATIIVIANMIGSGIFGNTGYIQEQVGAPWVVLLLWMAGGLMALAGALCYAELSTIYPHAGGEYVYLKNIFGGLPSFLTGWISLLVGFAAPAAAAALLSGVYASDFVRVIAPDSAAAHFLQDTTNRKILACALVILFGIFHSTGVRQGSAVQNFLTVSKLIVILLFTFGGLIMVHHSPVQTHSEALFTGSMHWHGLGVGFMFVMFAYSGWNAASYLAEEIRDPVKNLPRSLVAGTVITLVIYLIMNYVYYMAVPAAELSGKPDPAARAAANMFGASVNQVFHAAFSFMLLSTLSASIMIGPRVYYAMARDGLFFSFASRVSESGVPIFSLVLQCGISLLYILLGTYEDIQTYMGFSLSIFPVLTVMGLILHRIRFPKIKRDYRSPLFPLLPIFFIGLSALIVLVSYLDRPHEGNFALSVVLAGVPMFYLWMRFRDRTMKDVPALIGLQLLCGAASVIAFAVLKCDRTGSFAGAACGQTGNLSLGLIALGGEVLAVFGFTLWMRQRRTQAR